MAVVLVLLFLFLVVVVVMAMVVCKPKKRSAVYGVENEGFKEAEKNDAVVELKGIESS